MYRLFFLCGLATILVLSGMFSSCNIEAKCNCEDDTLKIARVFVADKNNSAAAVVDSIAPTTNFGNSPALYAASWTTDGYFVNTRALLNFDISSIPAGTKIKSARLSLYWCTYGNLKDQTGDNAFSIYRITQQWAENTVTWGTQPSTSELNRVTVARSVLNNQSFEGIDVTGIVQDMINYPLIGHGFMIRLTNEFPYKLVIFASGKNSDVSKHPKLVVYY